MAPVGLVLLVGGILTWPASAHDPMRVYSFCALVCGTCLILGCVVYLRLLSKARGALASPSIEMLLDRRYRLTRGGNPWNATLWSLDSQEHPVASISWWQWASPMFMHADRIPVRVYGAPTSRAVIVVVGPDGVLAGRVGLGSSCPSEDPSASPGQGSVWLAKRVAGAAGAGSAAAPADPAVPAEEGS
jgi:hypothetical protein